ncbi:MAG: hypothetical protein K6E49_08230 [Lachnospiraceae bacterium]|nr:hypothetical protein [Lachnospiraceae bacterium]
MSEQNEQKDNQPLFRKEALERISSPEQLKDYLKVTNPGVWLVLAAVIVLMAGIFVWAATGNMETTVAATVIVTDHDAKVVPLSPVELKEGMTVKVLRREGLIAGIEKDEYGRSTGKSELILPDGTYNGEVVTDSVHAIDFLLKNR